MVSQPGVSDEAGDILKLMSGTIFDDKGKPISARKNRYSPFQTEISAYRFCAMVGIALDKKSTGSYSTKWSASSPDLAGPKINQLIEILGDELDAEDWVQAMNSAAEWGATYVKKYYFTSGEFHLSNLISLLHDTDEKVECRRCGAFNVLSVEKCWTGCGEEI